MIHPQFDPVALSLGPLQVHWYGFMYLLAFAAAYGLAWYRSTKREGWNAEMVSDLVFFGALGVILGGRIGYVILYAFDLFLKDPTYLFKVWDGGMSFHGGFVGVALAMIYFGKKYKKPVFAVLDFIAPCVPTGLLFGRIGNYINGELWGRVSDGGYNWLTYFPHAVVYDERLISTNQELGQLASAVPNTEINPDWLSKASPYLQEYISQHSTLYLLPRHPSQLYEAFAEGLLLFILLWWFSAKPRPRMAVSALFLLIYGISRFIIEFYRQPDAGYELIMGWMSKGQLYTIPMLLFGIALMILAYRRQKYDWGKYAN